MPNPFIPEDCFVFAELFAFQDHALVNFVGGGGKTALIRTLMHEYAARGPVLWMTTTRSHPPDPADGFAVISGDNVPLLHKIIAAVSRNCPEHPYKVMAARHFMSPHLLRGVPPDFADALDRRAYPIFLNEADGAAGFSLKLPRANEPVLMQHAEYLVPVIGVDCIGQQLGSQSLFRWQELGEAFSLRAGERITPQLAAGIFLHPQGVCRNWQKGMTLIPFINKVDGPEQEEEARALASLILQNPNFPVARVLWGSVLKGTAASLTAA